MEKSYLIPYPVWFITQKLKQEGFEAFLVGGAVRDLLVERERVIDWDITTNATPEETQKLLLESFYDNNFGTVMVAAKHVMEQANKSGEYPELDVFDITTYRTESGYTDKRRPDMVEWGKSLLEDMKRRDFTINAMALELVEIEEEIVRENGLWLRVKTVIHDPYSGREDLENRLVKTVGKSDDRFGEDALRMMRAIRLAAQLGFEIEAETKEAIKRNADEIEKISKERVRDELLKILGSGHAAEGIETLEETGLLKHILPELLEAKEVEQGGHHIYDVWKHSIESLRGCPSSDPIVRLATLIHDVGKPRTMEKQGPRGVTFYGHEVVGAHISKEIAERLKLSNKQKQKLFTLVRWHMFTYQPEMTDAAIRRFIKRVGVENINDMMMLRVGDRKGGGSRATSWRLRELQQRIGENLYEPMSVRDLKIDGHELMDKLSIKPGPILGKILNQLFEEVMDGALENTSEKLLERSAQLFDKWGQENQEVIPGDE